MKILIACEESQTVCKAFRELGYEAYSCDILPCSGGHPEWHLQENISAILQSDWDLMIAHPPCTRLTVSANKWYKEEYRNRFPNIMQERQNAIDFFLMLVNSDIPKIAIENPVGIMSTRYRKPDQIIQPYMFGDAERKTTCLWLKNLPKLIPTDIVEPELYTYKNGKTDGMWHVKTMKLPKEERSRIRSITFDGIANAMAEQWGKCL